jgi:hypothetical protein
MSAAQGNSPMGSNQDSNNPWSQPKVEVEMEYVLIAVEFQPVVQLAKGWGEEHLKEAAELWAKKERISQPITHVEEIV